MADEIVAKSLRIVGDDGNTVAELGSNRNGHASFILYDQKGNPGLIVGVGVGGVEINLYGADEFSHAGLALSNLHGPILHLFNGEESRVRITTTDTRGARPQIEMVGDAGTIELGSTRGMGHGLVIWSKDGERIISAEETRHTFDDKPELSMTIHDMSRGRGGKIKVWKL